MISTIKRKEARDNLLKTLLRSSLTSELLGDAPRLANLAKQLPLRLGIVHLEYWPLAVQARSRLDRTGQAPPRDDRVASALHELVEFLVELHDVGPARAPKVTSDDLGFALLFEVAVIFWVRRLLRNLYGHVILIRRCFWNISIEHDLLLVAAHDIEARAL